MSAGDMSAPTESAVKADAEQPREAAGPSPKRTYANGKPYDDLLCTICGLTSCWQSPKNARPAGQNT
jgi:hypothetical protein